MGKRRAVLTEQMVAKIIAAGALPMPLHKVASIAGIHRVTLWKWLRAGELESKSRELGNEPDEALDLAVLLWSGWCLADAEAMRRTLAKIDAASDAGVWQASAWILERRWPSDFSSDRRELNQLRRKLAELERIIGQKEQATPA